MAITPEKFRRQAEEFRILTEKDGRFIFNDQNSIPCYEDIDSPHTYCPIYLMHTGWAARVIAKTRPAEHVDIGGLTYFAGIASAIVPFKYYDFNPIKIPLPGIVTGQVNLTRLPFGSGEIQSLSCLHVIEHIGLGRYGDDLNVTGDIKACEELSRVVAPNGQLLIVVPIMGKPRLHFNAHRIYTYDMVMKMFAGLTLKEFTLIAPPNYFPNAEKIQADRLPYEGAGCFWFVKD